MTSPNALADEIGSRIRNFRRHDAVVIRFKAAVWNDIVDALRAASSPAPEVTVGEITQAIRPHLFCGRGGYDVRGIPAAVDAVCALLQKHRPATTRDERVVVGPWRGATHDDRDGRVLLFRSAPSAAPHIGYHKRDYIGSYPWLAANGYDYYDGATVEVADLILYPTPDPSGQVDRASAGIDADVGVPDEAVEAFCAEHTIRWDEWPEERKAELRAGVMPALAAAFAHMPDPAQAPPSPKGGNEIGKGGNEPDAPEDQCDSASGAQGELMQDLHEFATGDALSRLNMQLEGRIAELEAALKPFAEEAEEWADSVPDSHRSLCTEPGCVYAHPGSETIFTVGDLRHARRALLSGGSDGR